MFLKKPALHQLHGAISLAIALAASLLAVGCARNEPPFVSTGPDLSVDSGERVTLTGEASDSDGTVQGYRWEQVAGEPVSIGNAVRPTAQFRRTGGGYADNPDVPIDGHRRRRCSRER